MSGLKGERPLTAYRSRCCSSLSNEYVRPMPSLPSRRSFLALVSVALMGLTPRRREADWVMMCHGPRRSRGPHPVPRPGITSDKLPSAEQLKDRGDAQLAFDEVRQIPEIIDGIRCNCGCADTKGFYSLLSCYEGDGAMALACHICQGQGRLAFRLHGTGKTLDQIRDAVDARYG